MVPSLLVRTIEANFGIPIHQTIVVSFAGLIDAASALGGVRLDFPYPSRDPYSDLNIPVAGCQLIAGAPSARRRSKSAHVLQHQGLSLLARATPPVPRFWIRRPLTMRFITLVGANDGTSDFGRIFRQNAFLRAMVDQARKLYKPLTLNSFLSKLPQGITLDQTFTLNELIGLAVRFHNINANAIQTYTIPTLAIDNPIWATCSLSANPRAQVMFAHIFGSELTVPTNPPPNQALRTPEPPVIPTTTSTTTTTLAHKKKSHNGTTTTTTTTLNPTLAAPSFDPRPC